MPFLLPKPRLLRIALLVPVNDGSVYACVMQGIANTQIMARPAQLVNRNYQVIALTSLVLVEAMASYFGFTWLNLKPT